MPAHAEFFANLIQKERFFHQKNHSDQITRNSERKKYHGYWEVKGMIKARNVMKAEDQKILI